MSLKTFHLLFIIASILLALGFGGWEIRSYRSEEGRPLDLVFGLASLAVAVGLIFYERYFLKKMKKVSYL